MILADSLNACLKANQRKLLDHVGVTSLCTCNKIIGGKETDQRCLVIGVRKKLEVNELEKPQILPEMIQHGWHRHLVDVVEEDIRLLADNPPAKRPHINQVCFTTLVYSN